MKTNPFRYYFRLMAVLCLVALPYVGYSDPTKTEKSSTYANQTYGFSMRVPDNEFKESPDIMLAVFYASAKGVHVGNISVLVHMVQTNRDECSRTALKAASDQGLKVNSQKMLQISGHDAVMVDSQGPLEGQDLRILSLYVIENGRVFTINGTARVDKFDAAYPGFMDVMNSFILDK